MPTKTLVSVVSTSAVNIDLYAPYLYSKSTLLMMQKSHKTYTIKTEYFIKHVYVTNIPTEIS